MSNLKKAKVSSVSFSKGINEKKKDIRVNVEEIKNGFLITKTIDGRDAKGNYQYITEKYFSADNPLEIKSDNKTLADLFE